MPQNSSFDRKHKKKQSASDFLRGLSAHYDDLMSAIPDHNHRSQLAFLCETNFGSVIIPFQVAPQDRCDRTSLAYVAKIYGQQLKSGNDKILRDVGGINLLGDGSIPYWKDGISSEIMLSPIKKTLYIQCTPYDWFNTL